MFFFIFQGSKDCRTLHCPTSQRRVRGRCVPIVDNWNNFYVLLVLSISIPDLETEQLSATIILARRLSHLNSFWPGWTISRISACHRESLSETFVSVNLFKRVDEQLSSIKFLKTISEHIHRPIKVSINNQKYILKQSQHKHLYNRMLENNNDGYDGCKNRADDTFNFFAPKIPGAKLGLVNASSCTYCQDVFGGSDKDYLTVTELYYCDQVVFNESEYEFVGDSIFVPGVRKVFHDLEYDVVVKDSRSFVHVCADKASYVPTGNRAQRVKVHLYLLIVAISLSEVWTKGPKSNFALMVFIFLLDSMAQKFQMDLQF